METQADILSGEWHVGNPGGVLCRHTASSWLCLFGHSPSALGERQGYLNQLPGSSHRLDPESSKGAEKVVGHSTHAVLLVSVSSAELQLSVH